MKPTLFFAAALAFAATSAAADNGQVFDWRTQQRAYSSEPRPAKCFNGKFIAGVNRSGAKTVYVQPKAGGVFQMDLSVGCEALDAAEKISLRAHGDDFVCIGGAAEMVVGTPTGEKRCSVDEVRRLSSREIDLLATANRR